MPKTLEQRLAYLERIISDFFSGAEQSAKKTARKAKRKAKAARKSVAKNVRTRKAGRGRRTA
jgi:hypothetical protein